MNDTYLITQIELLLRLIVAGVCGFAIGYERKSRLKEAGVRTHMIVALGAALIMIVSKYGFVDVVQLKGYVLDPSRIAAQIVSGIGFLGAGMIFVRKQAINGLTTAAGVWTTAGVGMAIGAKLYFIGVSTTVIVLLVQIILRHNFKWMPLPESEQIDIEFDKIADSIAFIQKKFASNNIEIINLSADKNGNDSIHVELFVKLPQGYDPARLMDLFKDNPHVKLIEY
ncbi:MgtC/SapB family protein [Oenococcus oeni]|uniref:MgtC/SapB family protein n=1 Tax=Oenococcus oeni TaxID=1247 RepID=UPI0004D4E5A9|nr:MgtC/SapB family protein [Oenococcus oeni]KEK01731.1 methyltransferase [Oenococcus oeni]KER93591.1 methyltransferase [Oenococcus oeni]KER95431.1 methyltransferase [Oenococcus oeni]OIL69725.1 methyltransferase [Oenococcus oeni]OIM48344.1 methyltransferase [Oenococcus oeni]